MGMQHHSAYPPCIPSSQTMTSPQRAGSFPANACLPLSGHQVCVCF